MKHSDRSRYGFPNALVLPGVKQNRTVLQRSSLITTSQMHFPPTANAKSIFLLYYSLFNAYICLLDVNLNPQIHSANDVVIHVSCTNRR